MRMLDRWLSQSKAAKLSTLIVQVMKPHGFIEHVKKYNYREEIDWFSAVLCFSVAFGAMTIGLLIR